MTQDIYQARIQAVLQIRLDGAELWDVAAFIAEKHQAGEDPWKGETPLSPQQIESIVKAADALIAQANPELPPDVARHIAMRKNLYARAVQAGEIATAARILKDIAQLEQVYPERGSKPAAADGRAQAAACLFGIQARHLAELLDEAAPERRTIRARSTMVRGAVVRLCRRRRPADEVESHDGGPIEDGLVIESRAKGAKWSNVRLSERGERIIEAIADAA